MMNSNRVVLVLVALVAAASACGSSGSATKSTTTSAGTSVVTATTSGVGDGQSTTAAAATPPGGEGDPCRLLTQAEAAAAFGAPVKPDVAQHSPGPSCSYPTAATTDHLADHVTIQIQQPAIFDATLRSGSATGFTIEPVSGVGDSAFFQTPPDPKPGSSFNGVLFALKKSGVVVYVSVANHTFSLQQIKDADRQLGTIIAGRL